MNCGKGAIDSDFQLDQGNEATITLGTASEAVTASPRTAEQPTSSAKRNQMDNISITSDDSVGFAGTKPPGNLFAKCSKPVPRVGEKAIQNIPNTTDQSFGLREITKDKDEAEGTIYTETCAKCSQVLPDVQDDAVGSYNAFTGEQLIQVQTLGRDKASTITPDIAVGSVQAVAKGRDEKIETENIPEDDHTTLVRPVGKESKDQTFGSRTVLTDEQMSQAVPERFNSSTYTKKVVTSDQVSQKIPILKAESVGSHSVWTDDRKIQAIPQGKSSATSTTKQKFSPNTAKSTIGGKDSSQVPPIATQMSGLQYHEMAASAIHIPTEEYRDNTTSMAELKFEEDFTVQAEQEFADEAEGTPHIVLDQKDLQMPSQRKFIQPPKPKPSGDAEEEEDDWYCFPSTLYSRSHFYYIM